MAPSRDNMLEAFKDVSGKKNPVGGPFSGGPAGGRGPAGGGSGETRRPGARGVIVAVAALALAFVVGVAVGRATAPADGVRAAEPAGAAAGGTALGALTQAEIESTAPGWVEPSPAEPAAADDGNALGDPRNKYTLIAISISPRNEAIAWDNYDHLIAQGLPAFPPFPAPNGMLTIVVGAAPKESDLADLLSRLKRVGGPNGKGRPYEGAYATPIKKLTPAAGG